MILPDCQDDIRGGPECQIVTLCREHAATAFWALANLRGHRILERPETEAMRFFAALASIENDYTDE